MEIRQFNSLTAKEKLKIVDEVKKLYFQLDDNGKKKYQDKQIIAIIEEQHGVKIARQTLGLWKKKFGWDKKLVEASKEATIDYIKQAQLNSDDEEFLEKLVLAKKAVIASQVKLSQKLQKAIKELAPTDRRMPRFAEVANKVNETLFKMLEDIDPTKSEQGEPTQIIINEISINDIKGGQNE